MKIFFIIFFSLFLFTVCVHSQWVWQNPKPQGNDIYYIKMFSSGTGYAPTYGNFLKTTDFGNSWNTLGQESSGIISFSSENTGYRASQKIIYKTTNGGVAWFQLYTFSDHYTSFFKWKNDLTGFSVQHSITNQPQYYRTTIYNTTNGGSSWQVVFNDTSINILSMALPTDNILYMAGNTKNSFSKSSKFFKSVNGGLTWDSLTIQNLRTLQSVYFISAATGFLNGTRLYTNGPSLLKTTNGGNSWDSLYFTPAAFNEMHFVNEQTGYGGTGPFRKTSNGGLNWTSLNTYEFGGLNLRCFSIYGDNKIYLGGYQGDMGKSTDGGNTWISDSRGYNGNLYSIQFFDANTGIAAGNTGNGAVYLRTTNGGNDWDTTSLDGEYLEKIFKLHTTTAYIASNNRVFKTTNKGETFVKYNTVGGGNWSDVSFPNELTGYTISKYSNMDKTTDGGNTWNNVMSTNRGEFFTLCFINSSTGFYAGSKILKTTNGGTYWDTLSTGLTNGCFVNKIRYINNKLYAVGYTYTSIRPILLESTNEGLTWQIDSLSGTYSNAWYDISVPEENVIWVIGDYNHVHRRMNNFWSTYNFNSTGGYLASICFTSKDTGYISTNLGGILKTTNGGGTPIGINIGSNEIPKNFRLYQNYPNPFNPTTIIEYSLPKSSLVTIKVYDILGRFVKELVNYQQTAGHHSVPFDGSQYASGVYFYTIETPDFIQSKKMVLLK